MVTGNLDMIPLTDRVHRIANRLHQVVNGTGIVITGTGCIVDRDLNSVEADVFPGTRRQGGSKDENAAITLETDLEIEGQDKVLPLLGVNQHIVTGFMRVEAALLHQGPWRRLIAVHPALGAAPVEEQEPTLALLCF